MPRLHVAALPLVAALGCGRVAFAPQECESTTAQPVEVLYYVAPAGGSDANPGTEAQPWATIAFALANAPADSVIVLLDGVYSEPLAIATSNRIVRAANDGGAIFDGGLTGLACQIIAANVTVEGVHCRRGVPAAFDVQSSNNVTVRRVTAHTSPSRSVFRVLQSTNVLLEDVAAWGPATNTYFLQDSPFTTVRRCYARWEDSNDVDATGIALMDGTTDSLVENCVFTNVGAPSTTRVLVGMNVYSAAGVVDRNHFYGNVVYNMPDWGTVISTQTSRVQGTRLVDNVLLDGSSGLFQRTDEDFGIERLTAVNHAAIAVSVRAHSAEPKEAGFAIAGYLRDSVIGRAPTALGVEPMYVTSFVHTNNAIFGSATPYTGVTADPTETSAMPDYDVAQYGRGAYLIQPPQGIGAEVLYRYENRVLTNQPLWPFPLEERVVREAGSSVTFESGGGVWKTLPDELLEPVDPACP